VDNQKSDASLKSRQAGAQCAGPTGLIDAVDAEAYQLLDGEIFHSAGFQLGDEFWRDAVNAHGDELIGFGMPIAERLDFFDEV
jgi:hypothetical protein